MKKPTIPTIVGLAMMLGVFLGVAGIIRALKALARFGNFNLLSRQRIFFPVLFFAKQFDQKLSEKAEVGE